MPVAEDQSTNTNDQSSQAGSRDAALKAAGAAAATGAAAFAIQRALAHRAKNGSETNGDGESRGQGSSLLSSAAAGGWEAARDTVLPLAEDAADAAGKYVAEHAPDFVSERLVPRFIESFNEARG
jgi:hypothetical protein